MHRTFSNPDKIQVLVENIVYLKGVVFAQTEKLSKERLLGSNTLKTQNITIIYYKGHKAKFTLDN